VQMSDGIERDVCEAAYEASHFGREPLFRSSQGDLRTAFVPTLSTVIGLIEAIHPAVVVRRRLGVLSYFPGRRVWTPAIRNGDVASVHRDRSDV